MTSTSKDTTISKSSINNNSIVNAKKRKSNEGSKFVKWESLFNDEIYISKHTENKS